MITRDTIHRIYKQYPRRARSIDDLDMAMLFDTVGTMHNISVDAAANRLTIGSLGEKDIFRTLPLSNIHAFVPFEKWVVIVLHSSIIFLSRTDTTVEIDLREAAPSRFERLRSLFHR